jgi:agmatinase
MSTFLSAPAAGLDKLAARYAVVGIPRGIPYKPEHLQASVCDAPRAIRERSARFGRMLGHHDFDLGGALAAGEPLSLVDCGDASAAQAPAAVKAVLQARALPIVLGGDDSTTALALRGFEGQRPLTVLQIDAHIDYRDEVDGVRDGYSSPMRRASEMAWVKRIVHCGIRGVGSARPGDVRDTLARGNTIITAQELHDRGIERVLAEFPAGEPCYIAFDCDGVDPAVMPGTSAPLPGGLSFYQAAGLLTGLARRGQVVGINFAEHYPSLDVNGITALAIVRLIVNLLGALR